MERGYRFRLYPTEEQLSYIVMIIGCCRFVWNKLLEFSSKRYKRRKENTKRSDYNRFISDVLKRVYPWLKDCPSQALQQVTENLLDAYERFFSHQNGYPQFKSKKSAKKSFRIPQHMKVDHRKGRIYIPKVGWIKAVIHRVPVGDLRSITITIEPNGDIYASCLYDIPGTPAKWTRPISDNPKVDGVDVNLDKTFVSDGENVREYKMPRSLREHKTRDRRIRHFQRKMAKQEKDSNNREKTRRKIAVLQDKQACFRNDGLHKTTHGVVYDSQADALCVEDLNVRGMLKNHCLARHIADVSFGETLRQIGYKSEDAALPVVVGDRFFASSRLCSVCGYYNEELLLSDREWICPVCGTSHKRDPNACVNLSQHGKEKLAMERGDVKAPGEVPCGRPADTNATKKQHFELQEGGKVSGKAVVLQQQEGLSEDGLDGCCHLLGHVDSNGLNS